MTTIQLPVSLLIALRAHLHIKTAIYLSCAYYRPISPSSTLSTGGTCEHPVGDFYDAAPDLLSSSDFGDMLSL